MSFNWPSDFVSRMTGWLGEEADEFLAALARREVGLRLNPLRDDPESLAGRLPWETEPVPWCPEGVWAPDEGQSFGAHPYHTAGVYYVQDPTAMAAGVLLDPRPGEWVLDLAAAPGGKATHLAARMENEGVLVANEVHRRRASVLAKNLERMGAANAMVTNEYPDRLAERWPGYFDAVLVDAPCSGEGTFARDAGSLKAWNVEAVAGYAAQQRAILDQAAPLVRPGGRLLYGTCTFSPEEDEGTVAAFLGEHPDFEVAPLPSLPGLDRGHPEWAGAPEALRGAGRFWPHHGPGHGHFYALLRRRGEPAGLPARWQGQEVPGRVLNLYRDVLGGLLVAGAPEEGLLLSEHDHLYVVPLPPDLWQGMRVLRPGWWVASLRHNKVFPDHALAMALDPKEVTARVDLEADDPRVVKYLRGGFWADDGPRGFVLVTVDGFPLGWGKRGGGRLRSRYPVHLRG
jgi:16S rRNA C967 or C1407 C5-methylase (RsmB/RsmF family)/NOL1/NOP2/fmu family ribosome biogenesis protein